MAEALEVALSIPGGDITVGGEFQGIGYGDWIAVLTCEKVTEEGSVNARSRVLADSCLVFRTPDSPLFGSAPSRLQELHLTILSGSKTSSGAEPVSGMNAMFLQNGDVTLPSPGFWIFLVSGDGAEQ
jgi:hypothetical protein